MKSGLIILLFFFSYSVACHDKVSMECDTIVNIEEVNKILAKGYKHEHKDSVICYLDNLMITDLDRTDASKLIAKIDDIYWDYFDKSQFSNALPFIQKQTQFWLAIDSISNYNKALYKIGNCYFHLGKYDKSFDYLQQSIDLAEKRNDYARLMYSYNRLSWVWLRIKRYQEAEETNEQFYKYLKLLKKGNRFYNSYYNFLSNLYADVAKIEEANMYSDSALFYARESGNKVLEAIALSNRSMYYHQDEDLPERKSLVREALIINKSKNNIRGISSNYKYLAELFEMEGVVDSTIKYYQKALVIQKSIGDRYQEYLTHEKVARFYRGIDDTYNAFLHQKEAGKMYMELFGSTKSVEIFNIEKAREENEAETRKLKIENEHTLNGIRIAKNKRWLLFFLLGILSIIMILGFKFLKLRNEAFLEKEALKSQAKRQEISLLQKQVRSQLNPHFLFNNLNSIKSYIASDEPRNATRYLNKFASLMRTILNISRSEYINLKEELKAANLFTEIESFRLKNNISFDLELDKAIDQNETYISPGLIQPYIEKAIFTLSSDLQDMCVFVFVKKQNKAYLRFQIEISYSTKNIKRHRNLTLLSFKNEEQHISDSRGNLVKIIYTFSAETKKDAPSFSI